MTLAALTKRVAFWQEKLGISNWDIDIEIVDVCAAGPHATAAVRPSQYYATADLQVTHEALDGTPFEIDATIVHELLHIVFRDLTEATNAPIKFMSHDAGEIYAERLDFEIEGVVDGIARAFAALNPQV